MKSIIQHFSAVILKVISEFMLFNIIMSSDFVVIFIHYMHYTDFCAFHFVHNGVLNV